MARPRSGVAVKYDADLGVCLYGPTPANPTYRLDFVDPITRRRCQRSRKLQADAFDLWDQTVEYLRVARLAAPVPPVTGPRGEPTVDDLFERLVSRWSDNGCSLRYIQTRVGRYDYRLRPVFGNQTVRDWASSSEGCREVLRTARVQGLAPASVQDLGSLMRGLVTLARELRWIPRSHDPMLGVSYARRSTEQGQGVEFVRESDRPDCAAVERLIGVYEGLAVETGIAWLAERARIGAYAGLRPGERDALRLCDLRPDELGLRVEATFSWPRGYGGPQRKAPKNGKRRWAPVPASTMELLVAHAERRRAAGAADDALLFEDPSRPGLPLSESKTERLHITAALRAGWESVEVRRRAGSRRHLGPDRRPRHTNYSLRHHAAVWLNAQACCRWEAVSRYLGHSSVAFTHARYVRPGAEDDRRTKDTMSRL